MCTARWLDTELAKLEASITDNRERLQVLPHLVAMPPLTSTDTVCMCVWLVFAGGAS